MVERPAEAVGSSHHGAMGSYGGAAFRRPGDAGVEAMLRSWFLEVRYG